MPEANKFEHLAIDENVCVDRIMLIIHLLHYNTILAVIATEAEHSAQMENSAFAEKSQCNVIWDVNH